MDLGVTASVVEELNNHFLMGMQNADINLMIEQLELVLRMDNRICDNVHFAKAPCARPSLMSESCKAMEDEMQLWFLNAVVEAKFVECDNRQPCRDDCEGVDAKRVDFFTALLKATSKAIPTYAEGKAMC